MENVVQSVSRTFSSAANLREQHLVLSQLVVRQHSRDTAYC